MKQQSINEQQLATKAEAGVGSAIAAAAAFNSGFDSLLDYISAAITCSIKSFLVPLIFQHAPVLLI